MNRQVSLSLAVGLLCLTLSTAALAAPAEASPDPAARPTPARSDPAARPTPARPDPAARPAEAPPRRKAPRATPPRRKAEARPAARPAPRPTERLAPRRVPAEAVPRRRAASGDSQEPADDRMRQLQGSAWAMVGVTAVLLTVTGVFALMVEDREDEVERLTSILDPTQHNLPNVYSGNTKRDFDQFRKEGKRFQTAAFTFLGLTSAAAITAAALFVADHLTKHKYEKKARQSSLRVRPLLSGRGAGLAVGLEF